MIGTQVTIRVHENYVQTCVRFYGETGLTYNELARFGADVPLAVFDALNVDTLEELLIEWQDVKFDATMPYFPDFGGWLEIRYTLPDPANLTDFFVNEARYVDAKKGGRSVAGAFKNAQFKRSIMLNILNAIKEKDAPKLIKIISALDVVGG